MQVRLKAEIYIQALTRRVFAAGAAAYIVRRGDADAGGLFVRVNRLDGHSAILTIFTNMDGARIWRVLAALDTPDAEADALLVREAARDPDIWIVEIEDRQGRHFLDEPVEGAL